MPIAVPHALYRLWSAEDALLYVGITGNLKSRLGSHIKAKPWWPEVDDMTVEWHPSWKAAKKAETEAIEKERPLYNLAEVDPALRRTFPNAPITLPEWEGKERPGLLKQISEVVNDGNLSHAHARLLILSILLTGDTKLPRGAALAKLADQCGISRSGAYGLARSGDSVA